MGSGAGPCLRIRSRWRRAPRWTSRSSGRRYYDAADQAGQSRIYGGIHITADDYNGRKIGSLCGLAAWDKAQQYFDGTARA